MRAMKERILEQVAPETIGRDDGLILRQFATELPWGHYYRKYDNVMFTLFLR